MLEHLVYGIYLDVALLVLLQGKLDGHMLGGLHQHVAVGFGIADRRRQVGKQSLQIQTRIRAGRLDFVL